MTSGARQERTPRGAGVPPASPTKCCVYEQHPCQTAFLSLGHLDRVFDINGSLYCAGRSDCLACCVHASSAGPSSFSVDVHLFLASSVLRSEPTYQTRTTRPPHTFRRAWAGGSR